MKTITLLFTLLLTALCNGQAIQEDRQLYSINIFRWALTSQDSLTDKIVYIDKNGNVNFNGEENYAKLNMGLVTEGFNRFIEGEKIEKTPAYGDGEIGEAHNPEPGEQALHITVVRMEDHKRDKDKFMYPAEYYKLIVLPIGKTPGGLYKYLSPDVIGVLDKMLRD
ncbi:hypothetical protein [uncultured Flavobacterium sp.]|uniref:hypothetical protein n=1 Tax=uncultured Flavobacterium sp. TaxID=165435 RepID=UPI0025CC7F0C|nr:hypothetical protein [uncultured Flavobacterium sp.]